MKRLTTDHPNGNFETMMKLFAIASCGRVRMMGDIAPSRWRIPLLAKPVTCGTGSSFMRTQA